MHRIALILSAFVSVSLLSHTLVKDADAAHTQPLPTGAFMILPAGAWHHLWSDAETIIELHSTGPFSIKLAK
jgi:hypothetical protein